MSEAVRKTVGDLALSDTINIKYGARADGGLILDEKTNEFKVVLTDLSDVILEDLSDYMMTPIDPGCSAVGDTFLAKGLSSVTYNPMTIAAGDECVAGTRAFRIVSADSDINSVTLESIEGIHPGMAFSFRLYHNYDFVGVVSEVN
jgi:hypothetical protein